MSFIKYKKLVIIITIFAVAVIVFTFSTSRQIVDFSTQVKPIINKNCITCHGGVRRQADFSLLFRSDALAKAKSGKYPIIPGDPDHSEMIRRITLKDPEDRMPYKHAPLSEDQINILRKWIKQGAQWGDHWAYIPVKEEAVPKPESSFLGLIPAKKV
ncbi:MAG: c-type cytochrome domain-containing protein, partial [Ginsengibacter sp.]